MNASRQQHIFSSGVVLLVGLVVTWVSFTQEPAEAFAFPRLIAGFFTVLGLWNFCRAILGLAKVGEGLSGVGFRNILPGLALIVLLTFFAAKFFGFYTASFVGFFGLYSMYDPGSHSEARTWLKRLLITSCFMAVIYTLFALLLQVQTPRGIMF